MLLEKLREQFIDNENDPNARLIAFSEVQEHISSAVHSSARSILNPNDFLDVLSIGVTDSWSRIRSSAIKFIAKILVTISESLARNNGGTSSQLDSARFFESVPEKCRASRSWFEREGWIKLLAVTTRFWANNEDLLFSVTNSVALPALNASELPIREAAAGLLAELTTRNSSLFISVKKQLMERLASVSGGESPEVVHSVEGHLIALDKINGKSSVVEYNDRQLAILLKLGANPAASVRLYVAEILRPPSEHLFGLVLQEVVKFGNGPVEDQWRYYETIMMTLTNHLMYYLEFRCISFSRCIVYLRNLDIYSVSHASRQIVVALSKGIESSIFELKRISTQVLPLFVQFYIRYTGSISDTCRLYQVLKNCNNSNQDNTTLKELFDQHTLPLMWWYLAVYVTVRQTSLREHEKCTLRRNLQLKLYSDTMRSNPPIAHIVFLIMCSYFPDWCSAKIFKEMMLEESWRCILQRNGRKYIHFGIDFVRMMNQKGCDMRHLIPVWVQSLNNLMSHEQCIVLNMIKDALEPRDDARAFSFAYDFTLKAPVMVDGGEDKTLGYTWLRSKFPDSDTTPLFRVLSPVQIPTKRSSIVWDDTSLAALRSGFDTIYSSPGTEPAVLVKIREIMIFLLKQDGSSNCCLWVLGAVFLRLTTVIPSWKEKNVEESNGANLDDWDNDNDDDGVGCSAAKEKEHASMMCKVVLSCSSYTGSYSDDIASLFS